MDDSTQKPHENSAQLTQQPPSRTAFDAILSSPPEGAPPYIYLLHPERYNSLSSIRETTQCTIVSRIYAIPLPPDNFTIFSVNPPQRQYLHYEVKFLSRHALRVRFGFSSITGTAENEREAPFPEDSAWPRPDVKEWLETGYCPKPNEDITGLLQPGAKQQIMRCGLEQRFGDFATWVNPQGRGGMEYQLVSDSDGHQGFEGFYNYDAAGHEWAKSRGKEFAATEEEGPSQEHIDAMRKRQPLWKQSTRGPFTHANMPPGVGAVPGQPAEETTYYELFELQPGEQLSLRFHDADNALFFWTDRGWGCLVKTGESVQVEWVQRLGGPQIMLQVSAKGSHGTGPGMEYIIVAGEALERMKEAYYSGSKDTATQG